MRTARPRPQGIETWIFDLDNTLYPASNDLFAQVVERMALFISKRLDLPLDAAHAYRRELARVHGTTLRGLMLRHDVDPVAFMDHVHAVDLANLAPSPRLGRALASLPGRKLIHTNGSAKHAWRILDRLGIADHAEAVFDIEAAGWLPKPEAAPYRLLLDRHRVDPARAAMVEDMARNLEPAHALGMTTVWIRPPVADGAPPAPYVHHEVDDLTAWLEALLPAAAG